MAADDGPNGLVIDRVEQELAGHGVTPQALHTQGLSVVTTLDAGRRRRPASPRSPSGWPGSRRICAWRWSRWIRAAAGCSPTTAASRAAATSTTPSALHPAASTFKPIVLAAALEAGIGVPLAVGRQLAAVVPGPARRAAVQPRRPAVPGLHAGAGDGRVVEHAVLRASPRGSARTRVREMAHRSGHPGRRTAAAVALVDAKGDPKPGRTRAGHRHRPLSGHPGRSGHRLRDVRRPAASGTTGTSSSRSAAADGRRALEGRAAAAERAGRGPSPPTSSRCSARWSAATASRRAGRPPARPAPSSGATPRTTRTPGWPATRPELASAVWIGKAKPGPIRD